MTYDDYYAIFIAYLRGSCKSHDDVFREGKAMNKAVFDAMHHVAQEKWYDREDDEDGGEKNVR